MDIKLTQTLLSKYLDTSATPKQISSALSLCGPTVDRLHKTATDSIYDIEIITNRVDTASAFGVAREAVAILPQFNHKAKLLTPQKKDLLDLQLEINSLQPKPANQQLTIKIQDHTLIPRFTCIILDSVKIKESPQITKDILNNSDIRPINNVIDITNELTLRLGQPCHAFDLDKIKDQTLIIRESKKDETIITLDGKTHTLHGGDIVIEDASGELIDLCGIMGAQNTKISNKTTRVLLFTQIYNPKKIRETSLYLQTRTLAAQIFEKGPDPEMTLESLATATKLLQKRSNAQIASTILDIYNNPTKTKKVTIDINWLEKFSGISITPKNASIILNSLGIQTTQKKNYLIATIPSWRQNDISIQEDLAEEILRIYGYHKLPSKFPTTAPIKKGTKKILNTEKNIKIFLSNIGFTEIFSYSLVSKKIFNKSNISTKNSVEIKNPLTPEFQYMRESLIPSILETLEANQKKIELPIQIFEISNIYLPSHKHKLPIEKLTLCMAIQGKTYRQAKGFLEAILERFRIKHTQYKRLEGSKLWDTGSSAKIYIDKKLLGTIGKISTEVTDNFNLEVNSDVFIINLNLEILSAKSSNIHHFQPLPRYPDITDDITICSKKSIGKLIQLIKEKSNLITKVHYKYSHKDNHTFTLHFNDSNRNLTKQDTNQIKDSLLGLG